MHAGKWRFDAKRLADVKSFVDSFKVDDDNFKLVIVIHSIDGSRFTQQEWQMITR